jgi:hypothetical protein
MPQPETDETLEVYWNFLCRTVFRNMVIEPTEAEVLRKDLRGLIIRDGVTLESAREFTRRQLATQNKKGIAR